MKNLFSNQKIKSSGLSHETLTAFLVLGKEISERLRSATAVSNSFSNFCEPSFDVF